ncbi:LOW QUALITY PROTEIN: nitrate regulatory gene2 protein-like [Juglans microcarpa x Juglans regia]|uniref:LOW QUALITY PROTEIN: nitrate regulatory gene2 protein-like n=1 Tax=Juglans microcarpa x Juglans regia TaxID=2249226 RepID=UPI001B7DFFB8|nr:LOW QUALITY PROTEIN: nitrate regulatory gene2 protein-like [Juglans microcarpa x Juglans regia]
MGCGVSKVDDLPLVTLCRERRDFIKAASDHRYALAAAHLSYFHSLADVGDSLRRFVDEELVIASSSPSSPLLTLPPDRVKKAGKRVNINGSSSSTSISHSVPPEEEEEENIADSHLHLSSDSESGSGSGHIHIHDSSPEEQTLFFSSSFLRLSSYWLGPPGVNSYMYYMKRSGTPMQTVVQQDPERYSAANGQWPESSYGYSGYPPYGDRYGGFFGFPPMGSPVNGPQSNPQPSTPPPPPSPPRVSTWDFLNVFDTYDDTGYPGYFSQTRYGFGSTTSSPDSKEVRAREGIPDLEDETVQEVAAKVVHKEKKKLNEDENMNLNNNRAAGEGTSRAVPIHGSGSSSTIPLNSSRSSQSNSAQEKEIKSSPDTIVSEEGSSRKKGVSFGVDEVSHPMDGESSMPSSLTTLSAHGTRDLQEVVKEIRDEFETASSYGKEVGLLLEVGKMPYQPRSAALRVIISRIWYSVAPSKFSSPPRSRVSVRLSSRTMKIAKAYYGESGKDFNMKSGNLSSTLDKLYEWEKKLYKEVKDEERLRASYEKKCKRLKVLDDRGAESSKIDATRASIRKLQTKINVCIRAVDVISRRINKLRDEELQPQLTQLIHGLIKMWKCMLNCHQKQFQAIMESKSRSLKANAGFYRDSGLKATLELEMELLNWCSRFNNWINTQKSYVHSLNEWLLRCLDKEQEETPDGPAPFSPGRIGAPPIFIICNDWYQAMVRISEKSLSSSLHEFALSLHQLWERQDEERRQRIKAEYLSKDFEKQLRTLRMEMGRMELDHDAMSDKTVVSKVTSGSGVSPLDDLKVDLDSMRKRLYEERARHKETVKQVHDEASNGIQAGLVPIFEALEKFTSEALKAHEQVRLQNGGS